MTSQPEPRRFPDTKQLIWYQSRRDPDEVIVFDGETYHRQNTRETVPEDRFRAEEYREVSRLRRHECRYGHYPWDHWKEWALQDGVDPHLADLGRSLIREADQHNWSATLQGECGWADSGAAMIELALRDPVGARARLGVPDRARRRKSLMNDSIAYRLVGTAEDGRVVFEDRDFPSDAPQS